MKFRSYNKEIRNCTAQFIDVFDNMKVVRQSISNGVVTEQTIDVPCMYGPRSRAIKSLENRNKTVQLPLITVSMNSFSRDPDRVHSVNEVLGYQTTSSMNLYHLTALPISIEYSMEIVAKHMSDLEQILTTFAVVMNPDIYVAWPSPRHIGKQLKTQIVWNGSVSIENAESIDDGSPWRVIATTSFMVRSWLFPGSQPYDSSLEKRIKTINYHFDYPSAVSGQVAKENVFGRWYDNKSFTTSMDDFYDMIVAGRVNVYDENKIVDEVSGYYIDNIYATLSGDIYDFNSTNDLSTLIDNENDENLVVTLFRPDGTFMTPDYFDELNWGSIWRRMLSGDLSHRPETNVSSQTYRYMMSDENNLFLFYDDFNVVPLELT